MLKKSLSLLLLFVLALGLNAQDKQEITSLGLAPTLENPLPPSVQNPVSPLTWNGRAFAYNAYGTVVPLGPFKFFLNNPGSLTSLSTDAGNFVAAGDFDGAGQWWGVRYGNNQVVKIDTSTGVMTTMGTVSGAQSLTGIAYDFTTGNMYAMNYGASSQLGILNLSTYSFTPVGGSITGIVIDIACSNSGQIYGVNISDDLLYSINKATGTGTSVGPLGVAANYAQGMAWDHTVDSCYWASYTSLGELRRLNVTNGSSTLIGAFNIEADGFAIPGAPGPMISHTPLPNTQNLSGPYPVNAVITVTGGTISNAKLFWSRNNPSITDSVTMTNSSGNNWTGNIPGNGTVATYRYYLKATDNQGRIGKLPATAPASLFSFQATNIDTTKPVITHTPITGCPKANWPATVMAMVTDPFGVDSVWVKWYKNTPSNTTRFNLAHGSGNNWSGNFNSDTSQVAFNDVIYYKVFARDASNQHNVDSTAMYNFNIIAQVTACIGTGTIANGWPYYTFYMDSRTQMLWTAAEITAAGGAGGAIQQIGFNVVSAASQVMNGFKIQFKTTTASTISAFETSGWTTCYSGTYTVPGTGWQYVTLTTPFMWNGTSNIIVEICFNNSSYTSNTTVNSTDATGKNLHQHSDLSTGDGCTQITEPGATYTAIPNVCFVINTNPTNVNPNLQFPLTYALNQNFPNPFNPITKINYSIEKQGLTTLRIYDILGREVRTLVNEVKTPGIYTVEFNGSEFASGVYFYRMEVNGFTDVKRMILLK